MNARLAPEQPLPEGAAGGGPAPAVARGLHIDGIVKRFGAREALRAVSLHAAPGEIVAVCGPSGAGKSTLARVISGLETPAAGSIALDGRSLLALPPQRRRVAHMFESYALYPTRSVYDNIASPLQGPGHAGRCDAGRIAARVEELMALTEIAALRDRRPAELSGGQKQRVALCRTLVQEPSIFLLDEPIGHLDAKLRHKLRGAIGRRQRALAQPTLWFTPDAVEAMAVADRVVMLVDGQVRQCARPVDLYQRPADLSVARLVGDPAMNLLPLTPGAAGPLDLLTGGGRLRPSATLRERLRQCAREICHLGFAPAQTGLRVLLAARDRLAASGGDLADALRDDEIAGDIYSVEPFGKFTLVTVAAGSLRLRAKRPPGFAAAPGDRVALQLSAAGLTLFDAAGKRYDG